MADVIVKTTPLDPRAKPLIDDLLHEYNARYGSYFEADGAAAELNRYPPEAFAAPEGAFILLLRDGETVAGGAFRRYDERTAEVKRMWTRRDKRRQGLAVAILARLEQLAAAQGYERFFLTTGFRQPEAVRLYLSLGYTALFDTQADPETYGILPFEKGLTPALPAAASLVRNRVRTSEASLR
ncbi:MULTISPECIES: GNAT family N-acetyltransferase [unclassified Aureimonas]|uniref:GNAT family N-acetyltransferase n=1 Tax=unclassified Aureimonas TaxID=2615206 RepID=UPI0006FEBE51|nr:MULTISPECIES: GNAT family N-acetyltransferase [unclassified Aureimonas]KQT64381.1 acetyltransferase [Aureimonas sp. Leaf427]KQT81572.1 acetyltransferase [Aureimonas sp. Leaf460]